MIRSNRLMRRSMLCAAMLALTSGTAIAQDVVILGNAMGCFGLGCTPGETAAMTLSGTTVKYNSNAQDFAGMSLDGSMAVSNITGNFGVLSTSTTGTATINSYFTLLLSFFNPVTPNVLFQEVSLTGALSTNPNTGALVLNFNGGNGVSEWVPFVDILSDPNQVGDMRVIAYTRDVPSNGSVELTGNIEVQNVTATPEPASMFLLGTGLAGLAGFTSIKRRRRNQVAAG